MKKSILGIFLLLAVAVMAGQRTPEQAAEIAAQFTNQQPQLRRMHASERQAANLQLAHKALQNNSQDAAFYVFNQENNNGFVIISADDRTVEDVLGYSDNGSFDADNINPNLEFWLSRYTEEITGLQTLNEDELANIRKARKATKVTAIAPLLKNAAGVEITWYQEAPYYNLCPMDERDNTRCATGCVATATAAIMYKWRWPLQGTGSKSYTWYDCLDDNCYQYKTKTLSVNFAATTYDWDNLLPAYEGKSYTTDQANAVATLMYHCGVACKMQYGGDATGGSGAWTDDMAYGLQTYFDYTFDKFITMYSKTKYENSVKGVSVANVPAEFGVTKDQITTYFNADLEAGRPILMGGEGSRGGHEFVCDGRDADNKFHINFGWEGGGNGYYTLSALGPSGSQFSNNLDAIIGIVPNKPDVDPFDVTWMSNGELFTTTSSTGAVVLPTTNPTACEGKVFVGWTAIANYSNATTAPTFVKAGDAVEEGAVFYAVFATKDGAGNEPTTVASVTFKSADSDSNQDNSENIAAKLVESSTGISSYSGLKLYVGKSGMKMGTSSATGSITLTLAKTVAVSKVVINGDKYGSDTGKLRVTSGATDLGSQTPAANMEFVANPAIETNTITVSTTSKRAYVSSIAVIAGTGASYKNYSTTCGGGTDVENTVVAPKAIKVIENGQVVIVREDGKYNVLGQPIQ